MHHCYTKRLHRQKTALLCVGVLVNCVLCGQSILGHCTICVGHQGFHLCSIIPLTSLYVENTYKYSVNGSSNIYSFKHKRVVKEKSLHVWCMVMQLKNHWKLLIQDLIEIKRLVEKLCIWSRRTFLAKKIYMHLK